jgi:hypothetical protein
MTVTPSKSRQGSGGYLVLNRVWKSGDKIQIDIPMEPRLLEGDHLNKGKAALFYGPLVLAADESLLGDDAAQQFNTIALPKVTRNNLSALAFSPETELAGAQANGASQHFRINAAHTIQGGQFETSLVPFSQAGASGKRYKVWLPIAGQPEADLLLHGIESRSRQGNLEGSIIDNDLKSPVTTFDGKRAAEDWFAVEVKMPVAIKRLIFTHGKNFHDGGWFDTSAGKPRVQIRRTTESDWETVGEVADYPLTTSGSGQHDRLTWANRQFTVKFPKPITFNAVRIIGVPSCGDNPEQSFSSCAELQAFSD